GANRRLRERLDEAAQREQYQVHYPRLEFCTDNGAMIAFAGAFRLESLRQQSASDYAFTVKPRWDLADLQRP
ncbi:MAG TPA: tRNA (adenosine(37)-N6)-threonylcarbamoyltransferase complex transferase subunit TsaD, partial [Methylophilaceae bacterium]|nr:tRNA (adenosine(37)-N6)-threonylcarbamoyltransferase complex transferase subunit TsaD [Methylophilaceae bacterium]